MTFPLFASIDINLFSLFRTVEMHLTEQRAIRKLIKQKMKEKRNQNKKENRQIEFRLAIRTHRKGGEGKAQASLTRLRFHEYFVRQWQSHVSSCSRAKHQMNAFRDSWNAARLSNRLCECVNAFKMPNKIIKMNVPPAKFFVCHCHSHGKAAYTEAASADIEHTIDRSASTTFAHFNLILISRCWFLKIIFVLRWVSFLDSNAQAVIKTSPSPFRTAVDTKVAEKRANSFDYFAICFILNIYSIYETNFTRISTKFSDCKF